MASTSFLHRYATFIVARARIVVAGTVILTTLLAAQIPRLQVHFDPASSLPPDHPFVQIDRRVREEFGGRNTVIMGVIPRSGTVWTVPVLRRVHELTQQVLDLDGLMRHTMVSLASPNMRHLEDRDGTLAEDYLMREPPEDDADVAEVRRRYAANPLAQGMVVSPDERAAMLVFDFWDGTDIHSVAKGAVALADRFTDDVASVHVFGEPIVIHDDFEYSAHMAPMFVVSFVAIMAVLYASFRSVQGMLIPMLTALFSVIADLGVMALAGVAIDPWNQAVPILVITIASGHSAQMMKRYYEELALRRDNRAAVIATVERIGPVMLAAGTTAAIGFASLVVFGVPAISGYGLATAYGIASAVALEMTFIPALRSLLPVRMKDVQPTVRGGRIVRVLEGVARAATGPGRRVIAGVAAAVLIVSVVGAVQIRSWASLREYFLKGSRSRLDLEILEPHFPGTNTMTVLIEGAPGAVQSPEVIGFLDGFGAELRNDPAVSMTSSLADLIRFIRKVFDPESGGALPDDRATLAQLIFLGSSPAFERFADRSYARTVFWAYLRTDASDAMRGLLERTNRYVATHPLGELTTVHVAGGTGPTLFALNEHTTHGKLINIGMILFVVFLIAAIILRSLVGGLFVVLPLVFTFVVNLGILGWRGFALDLVTTTIVAIAVGVGADYAMYLLYRIREETAAGGDFDSALRRALTTSGRAVVFVAVAIATGFSVMAPARHVSWRLTGVLLPVTMLVSCAAAITLVPLLVAALRPRFIFAQAAKLGEGADAEAQGHARA